jgi:RNA polymerase sigma-70 factor (ECF subfamily)
VTATKGKETLAVFQRTSANRVVLADWQNVGDEELVRLILAGDVALYEVLMRRYNQRIYRVVLTILRNDAEAEDVMQEAYVRAYQHLNDFAGQAKFATWLTKITVHEALARLPSRTVDGRAKFISAASLEMNLLRSETPDPEKQTYDHELKLVLERAIASLPDHYRSVFLLRMIEELDVNETAAVLDLGVEAVKTRLHRGRALLRKELERRAGIVAPSLFPFHLSRCDRVIEGVFRRLELKQPNRA